MSKKSRVISVSPAAPVLVASLQMRPSEWYTAERLAFFPLVREPVCGLPVYAYADAYLQRVTIPRGVPPRPTFIINYPNDGQLMFGGNTFTIGAVDSHVFLAALVLRDTVLPGDLSRIVLRYFSRRFNRECETVPRSIRSD